MSDRSKKGDDRDDLTELKEWHYLWIEAVARTWADPAFKKDLMANPGKYLDPENTLGGQVILTLKEGTPKDAWRGSFWILPYTELTLTIPQAPGKTAQWGFAMAVYETQIAGIGPHLLPGSPPGKPHHGTQFDSTGENIIVALDQMVRWIHVWPKAVARSWKDDVFKGQFLKDATLALWNAFNFQFPGGVLLRVEEAPKGVGKWNERTQTWDIPPIRLTMILPPKPDPGAEQAIALAAYAGSGRSHPFTLCCC
ncbi:BMA_0021/BMA_0022 family TOMM bacteriocin [Chondromyces crocatus]|uniref:Uncharacterized protein n=1 Tax=Chondromyces crocatus TaxID=52 RepID=A0A0K1ETF8_CHOCO|nr:BMA_0021/BMA_0022 family TOMM bacteriocin [Chondromyces crocatus]AKT43942.1 uncharacterized protein CMC5_081790 [Chondromyces crocatus]